MTIRLILLCAATFFLALFIQRLWIKRMREMKIGQSIKKYGPEAHLKKAGTPSMGGVAALLTVPIAMAGASFLGLAPPVELTAIWIYPYLAAFTGFIDDWLKFRSGTSEGLSSLAKFGCQVAVSLPISVLVTMRGLYLLPGIPVPLFLAPIVFMFLGVGLQNAVNVTDGLDGLAGGAVLISLLACFFLFNESVVLVSCAVSIAILAAFLWDNANPARLFMGDVGAHFWAGLLISMCVASDKLLFIFPLSVLFGVQIICVAAQIYSIRRRGRKIFKMCPIHHHFELSGWSETTIVVRFWIAHAIGLTLLLAMIYMTGKLGGN